VILFTYVNISAVVFVYGWRIREGTAYAKEVNHAV
jgi:hypothetical protein